MVDNNGRFDWDILLEEEPEKPPVKKEPMTTEPIKKEKPKIENHKKERTKVKDYQLEEDEHQYQDYKLPKYGEEHKKKQQKIENETAKEAFEQIQVTKTHRKKNDVPEILQGRITRNAVINGFIISELLNPPAGISRRRKIGKYVKTKY